MQNVTKKLEDCFNCGYEYRPEYMLRVINNQKDTLFVSPCFNCCLKFIEEGAMTFQGYRIEVMQYAG